MIQCPLVLVCLPPVTVQLSVPQSSRATKTRIRIIIIIIICDPILENGAYCGIYDFELEHTKDENVTLCRNSFYCINMFYKEIPFV